MKKLKYLVIALVVIVLIVFLGGTFYAHKQASKQAKRLQSVIAQNSHGLVTLSYSGTSANFLSLFNQKMAILQPVFKVSSPAQPTKQALITAKSLAIGAPIDFNSRKLQRLDLALHQASVTYQNGNDTFKNIVAAKTLSVYLIPSPQGDIEHAALQLSGLHVPNLSQTLTQLNFKDSKDVSQKTISDLKQGLNTLNLNNTELNVGLTFNGVQNPTILKISLVNGSALKVTKTVTLQANSEFGNNPLMLIPAFAEAQVVHDKSTLHLDSHFSQQDLKALGLADFLGKLNYKTVTLKGSGESVYDGNKGTLRMHEQFKMLKGGQINLSMRISDMPKMVISQMFKPLTYLLQHTEAGMHPSFANMIAYYQSLPSYKDMGKIEEMKLTYHDLSLTPRIFNMFADKQSKDGEKVTPAQVKQEASMALTMGAQALAQSAHCDLASTFAQPLAHFIDKPNTLSISLQPKQPINLNAITAKNKIIMINYDRNMQAIEVNKALSAEQKAKAKAALQVKRCQQYKSLIDVTGFSFQAN